MPRASGHQTFRFRTGVILGITLIGMASGACSDDPPSAVLEIFMAEFDGAYDEEGLFLLTMHPHISGHRSRIALLEELIRYIRSHPDVWFATHAEVARYCLDNA